jgi:hypothetical protein
MTPPPPEAKIALAILGKEGAKTCPLIPPEKKLPNPPEKRKGLITL